MGSTLFPFSWDKNFVKRVPEEICEAKVAVGGTVACESVLRSARTLLLRVRAPPSAPRPDEGPKSLRSPCCGLAMYKTPKPTVR
ncbi:hypothetical protein PoB_002789700 [Plakobranchus ocellatus]|uniref:Uncharacterized protein n=1 Tax=Plakobranchus ocellatus TaxID=259542 RepID=A0AAV4A3F6_9GAST|nr:hypothetical protein PoB_002789700 [Plakobranchus ocellatus]